MSPRVSIIVPVYNAAPYLSACLEGIQKLNPLPLECIVVDDGSTDESAVIAQRAGFRVLSCGERRGPAYARNLGAHSACGQILFFVDADVHLPVDTVGRVVARFAADPDLDAVIGSYDDQPGSPDFVSQYRNLLHSYTHQTGREEACTFWSGCGAIRATVFQEHGGFTAVRDHPSVEDIELGLRLRQADRRIWLDKGLFVKHLKRVSLLRMLKTDLLDRAVPWTELVLRSRCMPADLNLRWGQRASVVLIAVAVTGLASSALSLTGWVTSAVPYLLSGAAVSLGLLAALNLSFYRYLGKSKNTAFAVAAFPLHCLYFLCAGLGFGIGLFKHLLGLRQSVGGAARASEPQTPLLG